jgi:hypothetical protein
VAKGKKSFIFIIAALVFVLYILAAAQPILPETVLRNSWLKPLESSFPDEAPKGEGYLVPFTLGDRFGYTDSAGNIILNKLTENYISISGDYWSEYPPAPETIIIQKPQGGEIEINPAKGYPVFLDKRIFIISRDQSSLSELDSEGAVLWTYDFEAPLTSIDAAGTYVLAGTLDGIVELLDSKGQTVFPSYTPASRITVILGCRISQDASKLAIVAGIDKQRFIFLERYGAGDYRVTRHEYLKGEGFRREIHMAFIDNDSKLVFEQEEGLGIFDVKTRTLKTLPVSGKIEALDGSGGDGLFFFVTSGGGPAGGVRSGIGAGEQKRLIALLLSGRGDESGKLILDVPFTSENVFLARRGKDLFIGGGMTLASFALDKM